jgi:hypothetical protein
MEMEPNSNPDIIDVTAAFTPTEGEFTCREGHCKYKTDHSGYSHYHYKAPKDMTSAYPGAEHKITHNNQGKVVKHSISRYLDGKLKKSTIAPTESERRFKSLNAALRAHPKNNVTAAIAPMHAPKVSRYTVAKIKRDHASFLKVLAKHFTGKPHSWSKAITKQSFIHRFLHKNKNAPIVSIKRHHVTMEPHYIVRVRQPHPEAGKNHLYNRAVRTKNPAKVLHSMLSEARVSREAGKQVRLKKS